MPGQVSAAPEGPARSLAGYYRAAPVRERLAEYCGASGERGEPSATGIAGYGGRTRLSEPEGAPVALDSWDISPLLRDGADVCRSLADRAGTLVQLDLDYCHPAFPAEPYLHPAACFRRVEPIYEAVVDAFGRYGLRPLVLMTARGYHFTVRASWPGPLATALVRVGTPVDPPSRRGRSAGPLGGAWMERAHDGAGRLLELLCHDVIRRSWGRSSLPVAVADVPPPGRGPFVCLDISAYGDPLFSRHARCAFSGNQKAWMTGLAPEHPFVVVLPRAGESFDALLRAREDPRRAAARAERACVRIPDALDAAAWVEEYDGSELARFHRAFDAGPYAARATWSHTYDAMDLHGLPPCAHMPLRHPDPYLLMPVHLRTVAVLLRDLGWHPRSIAELVRSRYESGVAWGGLWLRYDPGSRARFYTRVLLGSLAAGVEPEGAFTCDTQAARGACPRGRCGFDLARFRGPHRPFS